MLLDIRNFWASLGRGARAGLVAGIVLLVAITAAIGYRLLVPDYQVLFSDLTPQDTAAMVAELDKLKTPYKLGEDGGSILVDRDQVYNTRIKLMGKELPLRGAVGFELFNNSDFGMTEFAQKINYQRALQGEITRTILSLSQIREARVILVMPEQGLFKQAASKAKASITLTMKPGQVLRPEQVTGIQRLVSASVPGIQMHDVTILDQNGLALTRPGGPDAEGDAAGTGRLDLKKETEHYLVRKADEILERAFGRGQAMASVDVVLNAERAQVTTEDVVVPPGRAGHAMTGVVVRERETVREAPAAQDGKGADAAPGRNGSSQRETEYAVGRRVEQIVSQPGSIRKLQAVAVVRQPLDAQQLEQVRLLLAAAVGASFERGDTVVVHTAAASVLPAVPGEPAAAAPVTGPHGAALSPPARAQAATAALAQGWVLVAVLVATALAGAALVWRRRALAAVPAPQGALLTEAQRQAALARVQAWLAVENERTVEERR